MSQTFHVYIYKVFKQVYPNGLKLSKDAKSALDKFIHLFLRHFVLHAVIMAEHARKKTLSSRDVQSATLVSLTKDLAKHAVRAGTEALTRYTGFHPTSKKPVSSAKKAGLVVPPPRIETLLRQFAKEYHPHMRVSETSAVYLAAVVEYLLAEILELSGHVAHDNGRKIITPRYIDIAIQHDEELKKTMACTLEEPFLTITTT